MPLLYTIKSSIAHLRQAMGEVHSIYMRITIDLSDELFRRAKSVATMRGRKFEELIEEGLLYILESSEVPYKKSHPDKTLFDLMKDAWGVRN